MKDRTKGHWFKRGADGETGLATRDGFILGLLWLAVVVVDRCWFSLDRSVPAWDQGEYLSQALAYWRVLQTPQWLSGEWWTELWQTTTKSAPLTFIATVPFLNLFGLGIGQATLVNSAYSAVLLGSIYGLGRCLFGRAVGLWAAGLCLLLPGLYRIRLDYLLDYPLVAIITLWFCCLTLWWWSSQPRSQWGWALAVGVTLGLALLTKQPALLFVFSPLVWVGGLLLWQRQGQRLLQLICALGVSVLIWGPWYRTNWLLILTGSKRATIDSALIEGDPGLNSLGAWTYYWQILPQLVSWPLLLIPLVGLLLYGLLPRLGFNWIAATKPTAQMPNLTLRSWRWLAVFLLGAYLLNSLNINKDSRYITPYLPAVALILACGLVLWGQRVRWGTVGLAVLVGLFSLFPLQNALALSICRTLSPAGEHRVYLGPAWPHPEVIKTIVQQAPYLRSTIGVGVSSPGLNAFNLGFYGGLNYFQVYARESDANPRTLVQDSRSWDWYVTNPDYQGKMRSERVMFQAEIQQNPALNLVKTWSLPDQSHLHLYHRRTPTVEVQPLSQTFDRVQVETIELPTSAPADRPIPITYQLTGPWSALADGIVLLDWQQQSGAEATGEARQQLDWVHDHGIGLGNLMVGSTPPPASARVTEHLAMLLPTGLPAGTYQLQGLYLNRQTGATYPLALPTTTLTLNPQADPTPAPEPDLLSQFRQMIPGFRQGKLEPIFKTIARIHQYDPNQDYLVQLQQAVKWRLTQTPADLELLYTLALAQVLERQPLAIPTLNQITRLDARNPYPWLYLAVVHLYFWQPGQAQTALEQAAQLNATLPELRTLQGVTAVMQLRLFRAWELLHTPQSS